MKKVFKSTLGVTLLEVMLVLAIAAMIIVMSIRYYQSANSGQQASSVIAQITAIAASADSLSLGAGSYTNVTTSSVSPIIANGLTTPWNSDITVVSGGSGKFITITIPDTPGSVCPLIVGKFNGLDNYDTTGYSCANTATGITNLSIKYSATAQFS
jgi:type II secretory pathway pseudopilin PulG